MNYPQDYESEVGLLSALLGNETTINIAIEMITPGDFYTPRHSYIFEAIKELFEKSVPIDAITVKGQLIKSGNLEQAGGLEYLYQLNSPVVSINTLAYCKTIKEMSKRRKLIKLSQDQAAKAGDISIDINSIIEEAESNLSGVSFEGDRRAIESLSSAIKSANKHFEKIEKGEIFDLSTNTGFKSIDNLLGGFSPGQLVIIAARPGVGKSSLALNMAENISRNLGTCLFFSLEMSIFQLIQRLLSSVCSIDLSKIIRNKLKDSDFSRLYRSSVAIYKYPIYFFDQALISPSSVKSYIRSFARKNQMPKVVFIDYLQLMKLETKTESKYIEVGEITRALKILARELNITIVLLSQLNRKSESREDKRPSISDLRDSGSIEQDADSILLIFKELIDEAETEPEPPFTPVMIDIAKNRNGPTGLVKMEFHGCYTKFKETSSF